MYNTHVGERERDRERTRGGEKCEKSKENKISVCLNAIIMAMNVLFHGFAEWMIYGG